MNCENSRLRLLTCLIVAVALLATACATPGEADVAPSNHPGSVSVGFEVEAVVIAEVAKALPTPTPAPTPVPDYRPAKIAVAFALYPGSPLVDYVGFMVAEADRVGLDWRLLPAIAIRESQAGIASCVEYFNPFGWGSCNPAYGAVFDSWAAGITRVANALAYDGYYAGKSLEEKLCVWNMGQPCYLTPTGAGYAERVIFTMQTIGE